jgi:hypothetical protein
VSDGTTQGKPRAAGEHARAEGLRLAFRVVIISVAAFTLILFGWLVLGLSTWVLVAVELAAIVVMVTADRIYNSRSEKWLQGAEGEVKVGDVLDSLAENGWQTLHGVYLGRGDIDHIAVGPGGIFTVETKSFRGRLSVENIYPESVSQAYRHKRRIEEITGERVHPLLVFSDAYLMGKMPAFQRGVVILPARMLASHLSRRTPVLSVDQARELHGRLSAALVA